MVQNDRRAENTCHKRKRLGLGPLPLSENKMRTLDISKWFRFFQMNKRPAQGRVYAPFCEGDRLAANRSHPEFQLIDLGQTCRFDGRQYDHRGAMNSALVKVDYILVQHSDAA